MKYFNRKQSFFCISSNMLKNSSNIVQTGERFSKDERWKLLEHRNHRSRRSLHPTGLGPDEEGRLRLRHVRRHHSTLISIQTGKVEL